MRNKRWRRVGLLAVSVLLLGGCAGDGKMLSEEMTCSVLPAKETRENEAQEDGGPAGEGAQAEEASGAGAETTAAMLEAYCTILEDVYFEQKFPGEQDFGYQPGADYDVASNLFAIYDIDGDGEEELILCYTTTYTAGMTELIYGYDSADGTIREELCLYPLLTYYDNGMIEAGLSHNHGMAPDGDFWPYLVYQYDGQQDCYVQIASVDAWSKAYREEDYEGNPYPDETDADGDGMVYCITRGEDETQETILDGPEYQKWRASWLENAREIQIPYRNLIPDYIYELTLGRTGRAENG